jgi:hypothetical protein
MTTETDFPNETSLLRKLARLRADLPAVIAVPAADGGDEDDPIYRPLYGARSATVGELRAAVTALWKGIADDQRKAQALTQLLDLLIRAGASDDVPMSAALQEAWGSTREQVNP